MLAITAAPLVAGCQRPPAPRVVRQPPASRETPPPPPSASLPPEGPAATPVEGMESSGVPAPSQASAAQFAVDLGRWAIERGVDTGEREARRRLSRAVRLRPDAGTYEVRWSAHENGGVALDRSLRYSLSTRTLEYDTGNGELWDYSSVTPEVLEASVRCLSVAEITRFGCSARRRGAAPP